MGATRTTTILPPPPADLDVLGTCWDVAWAEELADDEFADAATDTPTDIDALAADDPHYRTIASALWS